MSELILKIKNVSKEYRLGTIGGGTLQGDLQSWWARLRHKEDPNSKIGAKQHVKNEKFLALDGVSLEVHKGDTLGIIGHNGAGKSTLLKLLSRVTAPTSGEIDIKGRIASMLEVGTGFHPELTGRENIYMNGAILGMTKAEIDSKVEQIIDFSECRQFIDTPVKRYSSGMYVKLAFSVAAHLDSEIMVMDEVLAVGDMKFQQKCLGKMGDAASQEGRTVLYVSHNMNTIRTLCNRCIVLDHGKKIFDGDTEEAIGIYSDVNRRNKTEVTFLSSEKEIQGEWKAKVASLSLVNKEDCVYRTEENLVFKALILASEDVTAVHFRLLLKMLDETVVGMAFSQEFDLKKGDNEIEFTFDMHGVPPGNYFFGLVLSLTNNLGAVKRLDIINTALDFSIIPQNDYCKNIHWGFKNWGYHKYDDIKVKTL